MLFTYTFKKGVSLWCLILLGAFSSIYAQLLINEVSSSNDDAIEDEYGESPDWIELYNAGDFTIQLENYFLTDNPENKTKWQFPEVEIRPNEYLLIFASGRSTGNINIHSAFKLSKEGEYVGLFDPDKNLIDEWTIPELYEDVSYIRWPNGGVGNSYSTQPTPGSENLESGLIPINEAPTLVLFDPVPDPFKIELSGSGDIYYSLDGSIPNDESQRYTEPLFFNKNTTLRARVITNDKLPSTILTQTFLLEADHEIPILSLVTDPDNLWDEEEGILVEGLDADTIFPYYGANYWKDISIPMDMEYFNNGDLPTLKQKVKAEVHGGRGARTLPQKPLRLTATKIFGPDKFDYPFFEYRDQSEFKHIVLRNASGDWGHAHMRDAYLSRYFEFENLNIDVPGYTPCAVYLNAEYYGIMNIRDKVDENFLAEKHGGDPENIELLEKDTIAIQGDFENFLEMLSYVTDNDLSNQTAFDSAATLFDVEEITDYFIVQTAINNLDWPGNNIKYWRENKPGEKWRFILFDLDGCCGRYPWSRAKQNSIQTRFDEFPDNYLIQLLNAFLKNEKYKIYFINRYADILNSALRSRNIVRNTNISAAIVRDEMKKQLQLWPAQGFSIWENERIATLIEFFEERPDYARSHLNSFFDLDSTIEVRLSVFPHAAGQIKINTLQTGYYWDGIYFKKIPLDISVSGNPGFTFSHWQGADDQIDPQAMSFTSAFDNDVALTAVFNEGIVNNELTVYPNPSSEYINIILPKYFKYKSSTLINTIGKIVYSSDYWEGRIEVKDFRDGIYFLRVEDQDGNILNAPVVVGVFQ